MHKKTIVNKKGSSAKHLYAMLIIFASLEEPKTTIELVETLDAHGFDYGIRTVQRILTDLKEFGFPIKSVRAAALGKAKKDFNPNYWQWSKNPNVDDNMMQAKSLIALEKLKEVA